MPSLSQFFHSNGRGSKTGYAEQTCKILLINPPTISTLSEWFDCRSRYSKRSLPSGWRGREEGVCGTPRGEGLLSVESKMAGNAAGYLGWGGGGWLGGWDGERCHATMKGRVKHCHAACYA